VYHFEYEGLRFTWDPEKARTNSKRHGGVTFEEAATVFKDRDGLDFYDDRHSDTEERRVLIGRGDKWRLLVVVYTERRTWRGLVSRIISARKAAGPERRYYEDARQDKYRS